MNQYGYNNYYNRQNSYYQPANNYYGNGYGYNNGGYNGGYNNGGYNGNNNKNNNDDSSTPIWLKVLLPTVASFAVILALLFTSGAVGGNSDPTPITVPETSSATSAAEEKKDSDSIIQIITPQQGQQKEYVYQNDNNYYNYNYNYTYDDFWDYFDVPQGYVYTTGRYKVVAEFLPIYTGPGYDYSVVPYSKMSDNAKAQILKNHGHEGDDCLVYGCVADVSKVDGNWGKIPSGWINLDECEKI